MSQVSTSTAVTTTPPVTVVSSGMSSLSLVTMALMGLPTTLGQHDVVLPPPLTPRGFGGHASVPQQQPPSLMPLQACPNYAMGSLQVGFFFRVEPSTILYIICLVSVLVSAFYFRCHAGCHNHLWGLNHWGLHHCKPLQITHGRHMCNREMVISPHQVCTEWAAPSTTLSRGSLMLLHLLFPGHPIYMVGHTALGT